MTKSACALLLAIAPLASTNAARAAAQNRDTVVDIRAINALDCTFRLTNDHVEGTIMMQDATYSAEACRAACTRFAEQSVLSMRDSVMVLRYTCHYRDQLVADINLMQG